MPTKTSSASSSASKAEQQAVKEQQAAAAQREQEAAEAEQRQQALADEQTERANAENAAYEKERKADKAFKSRAVEAPDTSPGGFYISIAALEEREQVTAEQAQHKAEGA